jgi:hypothetical protein
MALAGRTFARQNGFIGDSCGRKKVADALPRYLLAMRS